MTCRQCPLARWIAGKRDSLVRSIARERDLEQEQGQGHQCGSAAAGLRTGTSPGTASASDPAPGDTGPIPDGQDKSAPLQVSCNDT